jgi:RsiW-degrading membrane proteinase PrsW (M82 family)
MSAPSSSPPAPWRRRPLIPSQLLLLGGLLAFVLACAGLERVIAPSTASPSLGPAASAALVLVPALLWLAYFYLQDRYEPEPTHLVAGVFLLGALVAEPLARWVTDDLYRVAEWVRLPWSAAEVLASFLVVAAAQELAKYVVVRYTIYLSDEFDEPMDGIVYGTACGIGFATAWGFHLAGRAGGLGLSAGAMNVVIGTLAHACFSAVWGYALGRAKFTPSARARAGLLVLGYLAAVLCNGVFFLLEERVTRRGLDYSPWPGLAAAAVFSSAVFALTSLLARRQLAISPYREEAAS